MKSVDTRIAAPEDLLHLRELLKKPIQNGHIAEENCHEWNTKWKLISRNCTKKLSVRINAITLPRRMFRHSGAKSVCVEASLSLLRNGVFIQKRMCTIKLRNDSTCGKLDLDSSRSRDDSTGFFHCRDADQKVTFDLNFLKAQNCRTTADQDWHLVLTIEENKTVTKRIDEAKDLASTIKDSSVKSTNNIDGVDGVAHGDVDNTEEEFAHNSEDPHERSSGITCTIDLSERRENSKNCRLEYNRLDSSDVSDASDEESETSEDMDSFKCVMEKKPKISHGFLGNSRLRLDFMADSMRIGGASIRLFWSYGFEKGDPSSSTLFSDCGDWYHEFCSRRHDRYQPLVAGYHSSAHDIKSSGIKSRQPGRCIKSSRTANVSAINANDNSRCDGFTSRISNVLLRSRHPRVHIQFYSGDNFRDSEEWTNTSDNTTNDLSTTNPTGIVSQGNGRLLERLCLPGFTCCFCKISFLSFCRLMCHMGINHGDEFNFEYLRRGEKEYVLKISKLSERASHKGENYNRFRKDSDHDGDSESGELQKSSNDENIESSLHNSRSYSKQFTYIRTGRPNSRRKIVEQILKRYATPRSHWQAEYEEYDTNARNDIEKQEIKGWKSGKKTADKGESQKYGRQFYHASDMTPLNEIDTSFDSDAEENVDNRWLIDRSTQSLVEDEELTHGEIHFMSQWNRFVLMNRRQNFYSDTSFPRACERFVKQNARWILENGLRQHLLVHLMGMWEWAIIHPSQIARCMAIVDVLGGESCMKLPKAINQHKNFPYIHKIYEEGEDEDDYDGFLLEDNYNGFLLASGAFDDENSKEENPEIGVVFAGKGAREEKKKKRAKSSKKGSGTKYGSIKGRKPVLLPLRKSNRIVKGRGKKRGLPENSSDSGDGYQGTNCKIPKKICVNSVASGDGGN